MGSSPATGSNFKSSYVKMVLDNGEWVIPANPVWRQIPMVSGAPANDSYDTLQSQKLTGNPDLDAPIGGAINVGGETSVELNYSGHDAFFESVMQGEFVQTAPLTAKDFTVNSGNVVVFSGEDLTSNFKANDMIKLLDTILVVSSVNYDGSDTTLSLIGDEIAQGDYQDQTIDLSKKLKTGSSQVRIAILNEYLLNGSPVYDIATECQVTAFSFTGPANEILNGTFTILGGEMKTNTTLPSGSTFEMDQDAFAYSSFSASLAKDGASYGGATSIEFGLNRNASAKFVIGSRYMDHIEYGAAENTLKVSSFYTNDEIAEKVENEDDVSFNLMLSKFGKGMAFTYPTAKVTSATKEVGGRGDITQNPEFKPYRSKNGDTALMIQSL